MEFKLQEYIEPDFENDLFVNAPDAEFVGAPKDMAAPDNFHATSIFPEYFKVNGEWLCGGISHGLPSGLGRWEDSCSGVSQLKKGDLVAVGRSEDGEEGYLSTLTVSCRMRTMWIRPFPSVREEQGDRVLL